MKNDYEEDIEPLRDTEAFRMMLAYLDASGGVWRGRARRIDFEALNDFRAIISCDLRLS